MIGFYIFILLLFQINIIFINSFISDNSNIYFGSNKNEKIPENIYNKEIIKYLFSYGTEINPIFTFLNKQNGTNYDETTEAFYTILRTELKKILKNIDNKTLNDGCRSLLEEYLLGENETGFHKTSNYHLKKLLDDSSKHKNDLGSYDQCLFRKYNLNETEQNNITDSAYVIFILDKTKVLNETNPGYNLLRYRKNRTDCEDMYYIRAFCLPQATQEEYKNRYCSNDDYKVFMESVNEDLGNLLGIENTTNTRTFNIEKIKFDKNAKEYFLDFLKIIPLILCLFHVFIIVFREFIIYIFGKLYSGISDNKTIKQPINEDKNEEEDIYDNDNEKKKIMNKNVNLPNWVKVYNKCFNFRENFKELFNFSLNSTSINNDSGLSYIRGLKASSLFLLILGLTFFTFMNSLSKIFSKTLFLEFLNNGIFYSIFFIGLRYSPRIIFSCSGYSLAYKYLCYINKNFSFFYVMKFIFYQLHKYLILIGFFLFERYTLHHVYKIDTPMWEYLGREILAEPKGSRFILSFFSLSSIMALKDTSRYKQTLIDYFWLPYNEISFFILGVAILSIGYKYKLRIDYFLIITIIIFIFGKMIFSYIVKAEEGEIYYATLYYYIFDYGKFMLTPWFNLPCYLIGMYFGLINYSVQKGIISLNSNDLFQIKKIIKDEEELDLKYIGPDLKKAEEEDEDDDDIDNHGIITDKGTVPENNEKDYISEIKQMPFLIPGVKFSNWLRNKRVRILYIVLSLSIFISLVIHFIVLKKTILDEYNDLKKRFDEKEEELKYVEENDKDNDELIDKLEDELSYISYLIKEILNLTNYISNKFYNVILRLDIEFVVILAQSILFIFYFKGKNFINDFYCHVFWAMLNKSYFSYILMANPIILFIFYQSETKILLNLFNLLLYSLISGSLIFLTATFAYLFFELPYKRLIHYICSDDNKNSKEDNDDDEYDEDDDEKGDKVNDVDEDDD